MDCYLDTTRHGLMYLRQPEIASLVVASLLRDVVLGHYELRAYVVMANHVHALLLPKAAPARLLQSLKGPTAREANRLLHRTGERFWQPESYDQWVRDEGECERIVKYIESNPVKAGLVAQAEDYRWSSAVRMGSTRRDESRRGRHECLRHAVRSEPTCPNLETPDTIAEHMDRSLRVAAEAARDGERRPNGAGTCAAIPSRPD